MSHRHRHEIMGCVVEREGQQKETLKGYLRPSKEGVRENPVHSGDRKEPDLAGT